MAQVGTSSAGGMAQTASGLGGLTNILGSLSTGGMMALIATLSVGVMALLDHLTVTHDETVSTAQAAAQEFQTTKANLEALDNQYLANQQRMEELRALQSQGQITDSQAAELAQLEAQNDAIKTQITALENLMDIKERNANSSGEDYLTKADTSLASLYDDDGNRYKEGKELTAIPKVQPIPTLSRTVSRKLTNLKKSVTPSWKSRKKLLQKGRLKATKRTLTGFSQPLMHWRKIWPDVHSTFRISYHP